MLIRGIFLTVITFFFLIFAMSIKISIVIVEGLFATDLIKSGKLLITHSLAPVHLMIIRQITMLHCQWIDLNQYIR